MTVHTITHADADGYGQVARAVVGELNRLNYNPDDMAVLVSTPNDNTNADIHYTMWESTVLYPIMVGMLNSRKLIIVPNDQDRDDFITSGVTSRIEVCPLFCSGNFDPYPALRPFHFLCVGAEHGIPGRKRHHELVEAFRAAFPTESDVRLTIKRSAKCSPIINFDSRITIITDKLSTNAMSDLYASAHVGVLPGGMESWSLPAAELAAMGRASIIPLFRGPKQFLDRTCSFPLPFMMAPTPPETFRKLGEQAFASIDGLISAMRYAYNNPIEVYKRGLAAAQRATEFTPERFGVRLRNILHDYGCQSGNKLVTRISPNDRPLGPIHTSDRCAAQVGITNDSVIRLA